MRKEKIFIFDVESTSLHGTGFAVAVIVSDCYGKIFDEFELKSIEGEALASDWVKENVIPNLVDMPTCSTNKELRDRFFEFYMKWKDWCHIWTDCGFPVETNFLSEVVKDDIQNREFLMPYPLRDISTFIDIKIDRMERYKQTLNPDAVSKLKLHNPKHDCLASVHNLYISHYWK